ncbi:MAG TPA: Nif3-like dinuclear metal center hexameric protein [Bacteroidia bacterium]|jgi:dinuclear metal center YbgI/SA1388 family protein|nr:Nif3-like dinuclear metal center hexameric protein [Bacteroidia bacterium]
MLIKDILSVIEDFAPPALQESYDNSGIQCGDVNEKAKSALLCLDVTKEVLNEAVRKECNLIIAHHPLIFSPIKKLTGDNYIQQILISAIKRNICIYACHTNADNVRMGVNKKIAAKLSLQNVKILQQKKGLLKKLVTFCPAKQAEEVRNALFKAGCGEIGNYTNCSYNSEGKGTFKANADANPFVGKKNELHTEPEIRIETVFETYKESKVIKALHKAHPYEVVAYDIYSLDNKHPEIGLGMIGELSKSVAEKEFLNSLKEIFNAGCIKHTELMNKKVKRVALCGGSGSFLLKDAIAAKADVFITADFKYHQFFDAENKLVIADIGHYETEQFTPEIFYEVIRKKLPKFAAHLSKQNTNPVNYL